MEMEFFVPPGSDEEWHQYWIDTRHQWYLDLGIAPDNLRLLRAPEGEALALLEAHRRRGVPLQVRRDSSGVSSRASPTAPTTTSRVHSQKSGADLSYFDQATRRAVDAVRHRARGGCRPRARSTFLLDAYAEDEAPNTKGGVDTRTVLRLDPRLAPVKAAVLPLSRNTDLSPMARDLAANLRKEWNVDFDDAGAIGRRYRRQDEIGTPFCITVDFDSLQDQAVTIR